MKKCSKSLLFFLLILGCGGSQDDENIINTPEEIQETSETTKIDNTEESVVEEVKDETFYQEGDCYEWIGSANHVGCIKGSSVVSMNKFDIRPNNLIHDRGNLYILLGDGKIYKYDGYTYQEFLNIEEKVSFNPNEEAGLFGLVFHPTEKYMLVSYSNKENILTVEKYTLDNFSNVVLLESEILLSIPNSNCCHWAGDMIWSDYFNDFLIGVGDMEENDFSFINHEPLDTTSRRGKILFLNSKNNISNPPLISETNLYPPREDILGYGLRNPWKLYEYKNLLIFPDIGYASSEELNIVNLDKFSTTKEPFLFGWPLFEGSIKNDLNVTEVFYWENNISKSVFDYVYENSVEPKVHYDHQTEEIYRAALIGGDLMLDPKSEYYENYFFVDYLTKEMFAYDLLENTIRTIPLPAELPGNFHSLLINPFEKDSVLLANSSGYLMKVSLPKLNG